MSVKSRLGFPLVLVLALAVGFYTFGRGSKTDHSKDRKLTMMAEWDPSPRGQVLTIRVRVNGAERSVDHPNRSPWKDEMWLIPGETITLTVMQVDAGHIVCHMSAEGTLYGPQEAGPKPLDICTVVAKG